MAIVKMKKFELFTLNNTRGRLLEELQKFKFVHFVESESEEEILEEIELPKESFFLKEDSQKLKWMIESLRKEQPKKFFPTMNFEELEGKAKKYSFQQDFDTLDLIYKEKEQNKQELGNLKTKKQELRIWMQIREPLETLKKFKKTKAVFGNISNKIFPIVEEKLDSFEKTYFEKMYEDSNAIHLFFLISFSEEDKVMELLRMYGFTELHFSFSGSFQEELKKIEMREEELKKRNVILEQKEEKLRENLSEMEIKKEYLENIILRDDILSNFRKTDFVNIIEGYIPANLEKEFKVLVDDVSEKKSFLKISDVDPEDPKVPIILKNFKFFSLFESVTKMYALPRYHEIDPTPILSIFYWIFFGMMVADFAYGLILCLATGVALHFLKLRDQSRKFLEFFFALSFSTMIWGLIYGSAFGDLIHLPTQILDSSKDFMSILILSIVFGGVHLVTALGMKAYVLIKNEHWIDAFYDVFLWYLTLTSVILLILSGKFVFSPLVKTIISVCAVLGMLGIVAFSARDAKTLAGRIGGGLYSLYGITSYIGDFVSYLRLMALGLAGGFIAVAINIIVKKLAETGFVGFIFGIVIFAFGQTFNVFLSLLSAYVHTSRLTYVEFFSKFYEGGGKAFKNFRSESQYFDMKE